MSETGASGGNSGTQAAPDPDAPVKVAPGWYTVSRETNSQSYWDGARWTKTRQWRGTGWAEAAGPGQPGAAGPVPSPGMPPMPTHTTSGSYQPMGPSRPPMAPSTNGYAIASLVLSIVTLFGIGSLLGIIFGVKARREIRYSGAYQSGDGLALAGIIIGIVTLVMSVVVIVIWIGLFITVNSAIRTGIDRSQDQTQAVASCQADARTVEVALHAYKASPTGTGGFPVPPEPWSATTYLTNYGVLTAGAHATLHEAPPTDHYVVEFDASGNVWIAPAGTFDPSFEFQQGFASNPNACAEAVG